MANVFSKVLRGFRVVLHDPQVDREGKKLALILIARGLIYAGASAASIDLIVKALGG